MITIKNLNFSYRDKKVLKNINLEINKGEFIGIIGPTGSGKTTLALCLNGIIPNSIKGNFSGEVIIDGMNTKEHKVHEFVKKVGIVFQDPDSQIFLLTVKDEISFGLENLNLDKDEIEKRVDNVLKEIDMTGFKEKYTYELSFGEKQKVCIASVLAIDPDIIVLDEPTAQLDHKNTKQIYELLKKMKAKGKTIIVIEHKVDWLYEYADRILVINNGRLILDGNPDYVFSSEEISKMGIAKPFALWLKEKGIKKKFRISGV